MLCNHSFCHVGGLLSSDPRCTNSPLMRWIPCAGGHMFPRVFNVTYRAPGTTRQTNPDLLKISARPYSIRGAQEEAARFPTLPCCMVPRMMQRRTGQFTSGEKNSSVPSTRIMIQLAGYSMSMHVVSTTPGVSRDKVDAGFTRPSHLPCPDRLGLIRLWLTATRPKTSLAQQICMSHLHAWVIIPCWCRAGQQRRHLAIKAPSLLFKAFNLSLSATCSRDDSHKLRAHPQLNVCACTSLAAYPDTSIPTPNAYVGALKSH